MINVKLRYEHRNKKERGKDRETGDTGNIKSRRSYIKQKKKIKKPN